MIRPTKSCKHLNDCLSYPLTNPGPTVVGYGLEGALKFGFYETFKGLFKSLTPSQFVNFLMASVVAGGVASVVLVRGSVIYNVSNNV